jgi:hypothetical protein
MLGWVNVKSATALIEAKQPLSGRMLWTNMKSLSAIGGESPDLHNFLQTLSQKKATWPPPFGGRGGGRFNEDHINTIHHRLLQAIGRDGTVGEDIHQDITSLDKRGQRVRLMGAHCEVVQNNSQSKSPRSSLSNFNYYK